MNAPIETDTAVAATAELIDDDARDHLVVTGADAGTYLQSQLAQEIGDLAVGGARWTLVLDPTGKVDALARIRRPAEDRYELDTDAGYGAAMDARIRRFMIRVDVQTELTAAGDVAPGEAHEQRRVAAGWPRLGAEIVPGETIPATTGVVPVAVSFTKGCYPGQELVERMDSRGADAPRRLRVIDADASTTVGEPVLVDGTDVGVVTSVAPDATVAIASIKRGHEVGRPPAHLG
ncbi:MAG: hypothetical protein AAFP84_09580 [Actinomycetota bacterium]